MTANENLKALNKKWGWLCEDIKDAEVRKNTMMLLESSATFMIDNEHTSRAAVDELFEEVLEETEGTNPNTSGYAGANGTVGASGRSGVQNYVVPKVMFPVIRRVMPQLIANEIVSVQPISGRTGVVFYASYQFANTKGGVDAGDQFTGSYKIDEDGDFTDLRAAGGQAIRGQAYYSSQKCGPFTPKAELTVARTGEAAAYVYSATAAVTTAKVSTDLNSFFKTGITPSFLNLELYPTEGGYVLEFEKKDSGTTAGTYTYTAGEVAYFFASTPITHDKTQAELGAIYDDTEANKKFLVSLPYEAFVQYNQESSANIPEMQFTLDSKSIETKERKLKVRYTQEAAQDLKAHHSLDLEAELVKMASTDMNYEIDREIIDFVDRAVPSQLKWAHNWNFAGKDKIVYNFLDRHRALAQSIYALAGRMAQYNRQGAANWAIVSPKVAAVLQMIPEFSKENVGLTPNIYTIGSLNKIKYFVDPNRVGANEDAILLGFKSPITSYGTGIVYSPYANWMTATVIDPANFDSNKGFFSRYAITLLPRGQWFYAKMLVTNLSDGFGTAQ